MPQVMLLNLSQETQIQYISGNCGTNLDSRGNVEDSTNIANIRFNGSALIFPFTLADQRVFCEDADQ